MNKLRTVTKWTNRIAIVAGIVYCIIMYVNSIDSDIFRKHLTHDQLPATLAQIALLLFSKYIKTENKWIWSIILIISLITLYYNTGSFASSTSAPYDGC